MANALNFTTQSLDTDLQKPTGAPLSAPPGYELLEEVGSGGMGVVYRAREIAFDRDVAVKILKEGYHANSAAAQRFMDEARITAQLQHPAIPPVHHIGTLPDGRPFLAMKLIKGETLADLLARESRASSSDRGRFVAAFARVCEAVAYAHARKVIHRDLKPQNVMVGEFGEVQVMDWGLAKELGRSRSEKRETRACTTANPTTDAEQTTDHHPSDESTDDRTRAGHAMGTPAYMPPEQACGNLDLIDRRADVFALGGILCALLTGKPPYTGKSGVETLRKATTAELGDALTRLDASGADAELVALCKRCLAADREDRPHDAGEVASAVSAQQAAVEERAKRAELDRVRGEEQRKRRRIRFALVGSVLLLLALAGVGAAMTQLWSNAVDAKQQLQGANGQLEETNVRLEAERAEAIRQKGIAENAEKEVAREREKLAVFEHGRTMQVAHQEWRENNLVAMRTMLDDTDPKFRTTWEWRYLDRLCNGSLLTLEGHTDRVVSVSFSADGSRVVTASYDKTAKVWDARTGADLVTLTGHTDSLQSASFSADGTRIVTGSSDKTTKLWDAKTGVELLTFKGHTEGVYAASFSPDGSRVITGSYDKTAKVWDAQTGTEVLTLKGHNSWVNSAWFSVDGARIVTGGLDRTAKVWDARTGDELLTLKGHTNHVNSASWSVDGSRIVTGSADGTAKVWEVSSAGTEGVAKTGTELLTFREHTANVTSASFSGDGLRIVTGSLDRTAKVWDARTGAEILTLKGHKGGLLSVSFSADGSRIATCSWDKTAKVWDARNRAELLPLKGHTGAVYAASFSPDGSRIVTGSSDLTAKVREASTGVELLTLKGHTNRVASASFSPDGLRIVTGSHDKTARVWDARTGARLLTLKGHEHIVTSASFSPDGSRIVTSSYDKTAKVWDAKTGAEVRTFSGHIGDIVSASFSPDGSRIITGSYDKTARVSDARTGAEFFVLKGHASWVVSASFSADGLRIVTGSFDNAAKVWDALTGTELLTLKGHTNPVTSASFSPDGLRILTASRDSTAKIWDAKTGAEVLTFKGHTGFVVSATWSDDGSRIVTGGADGTAKVWDARPFRDSRPPDPELAPPPRMK